MGLPSFQTFILCGSIAYDHVMQYDGKFSDAFCRDVRKLHLVFLPHRKEIHFGGTGANICYSLGLLGERPILVGTAGPDFAPYRAWLRRFHIDLRGVRLTPRADTAAAYITSDREERQLTLFYPGAPDVLLSLAPYRSRKPLVFLAPDAPQRIRHYVAECHRWHLPYVFDPGQNIHTFPRPFLRNALRHAAGVFANQTEWKILLERSGMTQRALLRNVPLCVVTNGAHGSTVFFEGHTYRIPPYPLRGRCVDPTGCGDAYRAGFLKGWKAGFGAERSGHLGALLGSLAAQYSGTQKHRISFSGAVQKIPKRVR